MRTGWKVTVLAATCLCLGEAAAADWLDTVFPEGVPGYGTAPGVTVVSRLRPETEPQGIRAGPFILHPAWEQSIGYDDNVLGGTAPVGSWVVTTSPSLLLSSDWSRDAMGAFVSADDRRDLDVAGQSRTDWTASLGGSLDIGRDRLTLAAAHIDGHEDRTELDALPTDRPVAFQVDDLRAAYAWTSSRWTLTPSLEASWWHYDPTSILGVPASQAYRDRTVLEGGATLSYELAPQRNLVLVTRAIGQDYVHPLAGQESLNSTGYQALGGFDYDDDAVWRYRLLLGGEQRDFAAASYHARAAVIAEGEVAWMPSGMTTIAASLTRSVEDAAQEGVAGFTQTAGKLTLDHEVRRDLLLHASVGLQRADFLGGGEPQTAYSTGLGVTWLASRTLRVSATYDLTTQRGGGDVTTPLVSGNYTRNLVMLSVRVGL